jgi:Bacterial Ig-like domain (group 2)
MRAAQTLRFVPLALLMLGCSDPTGPRLVDDSPLPGTEPVDFLKLSVTPTAARIRVGDTIRFTATLSGQAALLTTGPTIGWFSSNNEVAEVTGAGLVQGLKAGTTVIWATYRGVRGSAHVTVLGPGSKPDEPPHHACDVRLPEQGDQKRLIRC